MTEYRVTAGMTWIPRRSEGGNVMNRMGACGWRTLGGVALTLVVFSGRPPVAADDTFRDGKDE
jgi:hypothetical protein